MTKDTFMPNTTLTDARPYPVDTSGYSQIDYTIIDDYLPIIEAHGFAIYMVISRLCGWDNVPAPISYKKMARLAGCSRKTAIRKVKQLEELKLIGKIPSVSLDGDMTANTYLLLEPPNIGGSK